MNPKKSITNIIEWLINVDAGACYCEVGESQSGEQYHALECIEVASKHVKVLLKELGFEICWRCKGMGSIEKDEAMEECPSCEGKTWIPIK